MSEQLLPPGFRLRRGWFGKMILQRQSICVSTRSRKDNDYLAWFDCTADDIFRYYEQQIPADPEPHPPRDTGFYTQ